MSPPRRCRLESGKPLRRPQTVRQEQDGFTLVELLVVIATIAILAAMLLPALAGTKPDSRAFQCLNNQRRIARAWQMYATDNRDLLVNNFGIAETSAEIANGTYRNWVNDIMGWTLDSRITNLVGITKSPFYQYARSVAIYKCPADVYLSGLQRAAGWTARLRSYSMNAYVGPYTPNYSNPANTFDPSYVQFLKLSSIPKPAEIYVTVEEHANSINDGYFLPLNPGLGNYTRYSDLIGSYHDGACGFAFGDGHAVMHKWKSKVCTVRPVIPGQPLNLLPFSADPVNAGIDAAWIAMHSSVHR